MAFAMFFLAEYANMILVSFLASIMFLGGWLSPFPQSLAAVVGVGRAGCWLFVKTFVFAFAVPLVPRARSRATATTRSCGWAGRSSFRSRWSGSCSSAR